MAANNTDDVVQSRDIAAADVGPSAVLRPSEEVTILGGVWPEPTEEDRDVLLLEFWLMEGYSDATDGCEFVEIDGVCPHGYPSWPLWLGLL